MLLLSPGDYSVPIENANKMVLDTRSCNMQHARTFFQAVEFLHGVYGSRVFRNPTTTGRTHSARSLSVPLRLLCGPRPGHISMLHSTHAEHKTWGNFPQELRLTPTNGPQRPCCLKQNTNACTSFSLNS